MSAQSDWSKYLIEDTEENPQTASNPVYSPTQEEQSVPPEVKQPQIEQTQPTDFTQFQVKQEETWPDWIMRQLGRSASRSIETILGLPGDVINFGKGVLSRNEDALNALGGGLTDKLPDWAKPPQFPGEPSKPNEQWQRLVYGSDPTTLGSLPNFGQQDLQNFSQQATKGYTEAQGPWEQKFDEGIKTLTGLMMPYRTAAGRIEIPNFSRQLGTTIAAEAAKEGVKLFGGSDKAQEATKLATLFTLGMTLPTVFGENSANQYIGRIYQARDATVPPGAMTSSTGLQNELAILQHELGGVQTPLTRQVNTAINELLSDVQNGLIPVERLTQAKTRINTLRDHLYQVGIPRSERAFERRIFNRMMSAVDNSLTGYGQLNPQFLQLHNAANRAYGVFHQSRKATDFIRNKLPFIKTTAPIGLLFEASAYGLPALARAGVAGGSIVTGLQAMGLLSRIMRSPELRTYYTSVVRNALRENAPALIKSIEGLDRALMKEKPTQKAEVKEKNQLLGL